MAIKDTVRLCIIAAGENGLTVPEFLAVEGSPRPQSVYPCFTALYKAGLILDSTRRRKSQLNRRSIVWVDKEYGGTLPVWGCGHPSYSYDHRAKVVVDLILDYGPLSVSEMLTAATHLESMSTSSLVSQLVRQKWLHKTNVRRPNMHGNLCYLYDLTPRGRQVQEGSPHAERRDVSRGPTILEIKDE